MSENYDKLAEQWARGPVTTADLASALEASGWTPRLPPPAKVYGYPTWSEKDGPIPLFDLGEEDRQKARDRQRKLAEKKD